ncbi:hypothetical protein IW261DRAFT_1419883 [Armillaria novae-zelandiae]|uniref:Uncharacterized protein n=1 Tax=Armillaria novae-zelandiae TaxID=153914 RepID=A0AA39P7Z5_9AGAR|nr:hypothetical protein IW261DRAFT_1419883 [Armillaria novae-zelandiae]
MQSTRVIEPEKEEQKSRRSNEIKLTTDEHPDMVSKFLSCDTFSRTSAAKSQTNGHSRVGFESWVDRSRSMQQDEVARLHLKRINLGFNSLSSRTREHGAIFSTSNIAARSGAEYGEADTVKIDEIAKPRREQRLRSHAQFGARVIRDDVYHPDRSTDSCARCKSEPVTAACVSKAGAAAPPISDGLTRTREGRAVLACSQKCLRSLFKAGGAILNDQTTGRHLSLEVYTRPSTMRYPVDVASRLVVLNKTVTMPETRISSGWNHLESDFLASKSWLNGCMECDFSTTLAICVPHAAKDVEMDIKLLCQYALVVSSSDTTEGTHIGVEEDATSAQWDCSWDPGVHCRSVIHNSMYLL